jgi:hypothetical protein
MSELSVSESVPLRVTKQTGREDRSSQRFSAKLRNKRVLWAGAAVVLILRIVACLQDPATALDLERMLYWGLALNQHGMHAASVPLKNWGAPLGVAWRDIPVNYPVVALMFFRAVAGIVPSVTFAKFVLTGIEALNALLVSRITKSRAMGFLYWASPLSIFWVSSEGQFEPVQNLFILAGMVLVAQAPLLAGFAFALAIQTKVGSAIVVLFFLVRSIRRNRTEAAKLATGVTLGLGVSVWAQSAAPLVQQVFRFSGLSHVSNFGINPFETTDPTTIWRSLASAALVIACLIGIRKTKTLMAWLPALGFLLLVKLSGNIQPWYLLLLPVLAITTPMVWNRRLLLLNGAVDLVALVGIIVVVGAVFTTDTQPQLRSRTPLKLEQSTPSAVRVISSVIRSSVSVEK